MSIENQTRLFPLRISTVYDGMPIGADICFHCQVREGGLYFCKQDKDLRQIRAAEWLATNLTRHLGIATANCAVLEDEYGMTYFGSLSHMSTASESEVKRFLIQRSKGELGQPSPFPGQYLSALYAIDLFFNNPDRSMRNFVMEPEGSSSRLCAIDFAAIRLEDLSSCNFPIATDPTVRIGRFLREWHGFCRSSALEMVDRIAAVPSTTVSGFLNQMPEDWMTIEQREGIRELWSSNHIQNRLSALRAGIEDESLL